MPNEVNTQCFHQAVLLCLLIALYYAPMLHGLLGKQDNSYFQPWITGLLKVKVVFPFTTITATNTVVVNDRLLLKFDSIPACSVWETPTKKHVPTAKVGSLSKSSFTENNLAQQSCWTNFSGLVYVQTTLATSNTGSVCGIRKCKDEVFKFSWSSALPMHTAYLHASLFVCLLRSHGGAMRVASRAQ